MILKQYYLGCLAHASYLIADRVGGVGAVVDPQQLDDAPELVARIERITAASLAEALEQPDPPLVLDVRTAREFGEGHIDGALNLPLAQIGEHLHEVPAHRPVVAHCASGYRSAIACSLLARAGRPDAANLVGGLAAWRSAQLETVPAPA